MQVGQQFREYNTHNEVNIKVNDAVKITSTPQMESFWIQVELVNGDTISGSVQNHLVREHAFNVNDIISFDKKNIKEHKLEKDRFNLSGVDPDYMKRVLLAAALNMSIEEFDRTLNIKQVTRTSSKLSKDKRAK